MTLDKPTRNRIKQHARDIRHSLQSICDLTGRKATGRERTIKQSRVVVRILKATYKLEEAFLPEEQPDVTYSLSGPTQGQSA